MKVHASFNIIRFVSISLIFGAGCLHAQTFRVLLAFTSQAEAWSFSPSAAAYGINGKTADIYAGSSPNYTGYTMPKVELAGTIKVVYTGANTSAAGVSALKGKTDGSMDEIHAARDWYRADIVILVHPFPSPKGRAFRVTSRNESEAFAVVTSEFFSGLDLTAHEIGHLVGCVHDTEDPTLLPSGFYGWGYRSLSNTWGDVMVQDPSIRKPWFGNPYELYNGVSRGVVDSVDCTRMHHERKSAMGDYRATPYSWSQGNVNLGENESLFWDLEGPLYFLGPSSLDGSTVGLKSAQNVSYLGSQHAQIVAEGASVYLKSARRVEFSGEFGAGASAFIAADTVVIPNLTKTLFRSGVANMDANVIYHAGSDVSFEVDATDTYGYGSTLGMRARKQIRLTKGFKIRSKNMRLQVSDAYDPLGVGWENILEKAGVDGQAVPGQQIVFGSRLVQEKERVSLEYRLPERGPVSVQVFDLKGRLAGSLNIRHASPGLHTVAIPGKFENGTVYFLRMAANGQVRTHRFVRGFQ